MIDPDYLLRIAEGAENIAEELHQEIVNQIIRRIMARLKRGDNYVLTAIDKWQIETLQEAGFLMEEIQQELSEKTNVQINEIKSAFEDAGVKAIAYDNAVYEAAGLSPTPLMQSPQLIRLMQRNYEATVAEWRNFTGTFANAAQQTYIREVDRAYNLVSTGAMSYSQAVADAVDRISSDGVYVTYTNADTGRTRRDTIETATLRAVRTGISQACRDITHTRMDEMGWDIILVSAHLGARLGDGGENHTNHYWWQGKFYSKSGKDSRFPPYSDCGNGKVQGIHGPNCRHSEGPGDGVHNPFQEYDNEENRKRYDLEQRQATLERRIRKTKREVMGFQSALESTEDAELKDTLNRKYQRKAALLQRQNAEYNQFCEENDLKRRADRIRIAQWDRAKAAKARGAATRYNNAKGAGK